jgi:hypothetical protein
MQQRSIISTPCQKSYTDGQIFIMYHHRVAAVKIGSYHAYRLWEEAAGTPPLHFKEAHISLAHLQDIRSCLSAMATHHYFTVPFQYSSATSCAAAPLANPHLQLSYISYQRPHFSKGARRGDIHYYYHYPSSHATSTQRQQAHRRAGFRGCSGSQLTFYA